jgi:hypothetical protein
MDCTRPSLFIMLIAILLLPLKVNAQCGLDFSIELRDGSQSRSIPKDGVVHTGQGLRIRTRSKVNCYVMVFWRDSSGQVHNITSGVDTKKTGFFLNKARTYFLPSKEQWFTLDHQIGDETLVVIGSVSEITDPRKIGISLAAGVTPVGLDADNSFEVFSRTLDHQH